jgi:RNA polymerase sigma-70 factor (ECF subfamily)
VLLQSSSWSDGTKAGFFRLARNITGNHEDAEEVAQNAFFKAFLNFAAFRGDSRFYTWLVGIAAAGLTGCLFPANEGQAYARDRRPPSPQQSYPDGWC